MFNVTRSMIDKAIEIVSKETNNDYLKGGRVLFNA